MADRSQRRLPSSLQRHGGVLERVRDIESRMGRNGAENVELQLDSEIADEMGSNVSEHSMSAEEIDEDDLLDDEEEYQKEMEDQRILDSKNGHFEEELSPVGTSVTAEEAAEYLALSLAAFPLCQGEDMVMTERECSRVGKEHSHVNPGTGDGALPTASSEEAAAFIAASFAAETMSLDTYVGEAIGQTHRISGMGNGASSSDGGFSAVSGAVSDLVEQPFCRPTEKIMHDSIPSSMENILELNVKAAHSSRSPKNQGNHSSFLLTDDVHGKLDGEAAASLDLTENRTLVQLDALMDQQSGPQLLGSASQSPAQVISSSGPSPHFLNLAHSSSLPKPNTLPFPSLPAAAQPNSGQPNVHLNFPSPENSQPTTLANKSQPKKHPKANPPQPNFKQIKPNLVAHFKNNLSTPMLRPSQPASAAGRELAGALFSARKQPNHPKNSSPSQPQPDITSPSLNMEDFPPISGCTFPAAPSFAETNRTATPAAARPPPVQRPHPPVPAANNANSTPLPWADLMIKNSQLEKGLHGETSKDPLSPPNENYGDQSNIFFWEVYG